MIIKKKRIREIEAYLSFLKEGEKFYVGTKNYIQFQKKLVEIGFSKDVEIGETVLPSFLMGPISYFNSAGKYRKLKSKPMETAYRVGEWHWKDWGGHDHYKLVDIPYKRYPREFIKPPSIELQIKSNDIIASCSPFIYVKEEYENIKHTINLFLEIFGECEILKDNLDSYSHIPIKRLNWEVLPEGKYPWVKLNTQLLPVISRVREGNRSVVLGRLEILSSRNPNFIALGRSGFSGYIVYGFENINLFILESVYYGNATYIFDKDWEEFSKLTKAEILEESLQFARIIHTSGWENELRKIFNEQQATLFNQSA
ncbi:MAG: hypothetical protein GYA14_07080 [Ignavibacteria bacterium]|nr:hypothetical protein [Ignavibacteria bacterium]